MSKTSPNWSSTPAFIMEHKVEADEIDFLNHVNNKVYLTWMEDIAWQHSLSVGIDYSKQQEENKIMVVRQHELNYLRACVLGDELMIGTWLGERIGCCQRKRYYEVFRKADGKKVFDGHTVWVCMDMETQRACKIPDAFIKAYDQT